MSGSEVCVPTVNESLEYFGCTHLAQDEADVYEHGHHDEERDGPNGNLGAVLPAEDESPDE